MVPFLDFFFLIICDFVRVFRRGAGEGAVKMGPTLGGLHGFPEVHGEDGPVGAICLKVRDIGGELFDDGGSGHF